jgi:hypothetical protein
MSRAAVLRAVIVFVVAIAWTGMLAPVVAARAPVRFWMQSPATVLYSVRIPITATLHTAGGKGIADELIELSIDGRFEARTRTTKQGVATFSVSRDIKVGKHRLTVLFAGSRAYARARAGATITIAAPTITVATLPARRGIEFDFHGRRFTTGADGVGSVVLDELPAPDDRPTIVSIPARKGGETVFTRWWGNAPNLTECFDVFYDVAVRYTDRLGNPIDAAAVSGTTIRSSIGEIIKVNGPEPFRVHGVRVVSLAGGLEVKDILYGIDDVTIEGTNVVNRAQQRFTPRQGGDWNIRVLFYDTSVTLTDALLGIPVKSHVMLEYPGGRQDWFDTDSSGTVRFGPLPRGTYKLTPTGVGMTVVRPLAVSRDTEARLAVITYLDIASVVLLAASVAIGLLLIGRPNLRRSLASGAGKARRRVTATAVRLRGTES